MEPAGWGLCKGTEVHKRENGLVSMHVKPPEGHTGSQWMCLLHICNSIVMNNSDESKQEVGTF